MITKVKILAANWEVFDAEIDIAQDSVNRIYKITNPDGKYIDVIYHSSSEDGVQSYIEIYTGPEYPTKETPCVK